MLDRSPLSDPNEYPDDAVLARHLGKAKTVWDAFNGKIMADDPALSLGWKYYRDGKSWLGKLTRKKKTVCWISVWKGYFRLAFYFTAKNDRDIRKLDVDKKWKDAYFLEEHNGKLKGFRLKISAKKTLTDIKKLIEYKVYTF